MVLVNMDGSNELHRQGTRDRSNTTFLRERSFQSFRRKNLNSYLQKTEILKESENYGNDLVKNSSQLNQASISRKNTEYIKRFEMYNPEKDVNGFSPRSVISNVKLQARKSILCLSPESVRSIQSRSTRLQRYGTIRKKKNLEWSGYNKEIADDYTNVDGSSRKFLSNDVKDKKTPEEILPNFNSDSINTLNVLELRDLKSKIEKLIEEVNKELIQVHIDKRMFEDESLSLTTKMAFECERLNEETRKTMERCLQKQKEDSIFSVGSAI